MSSFDKPEITRPASIVIRFSADAPYRKAVDLYTSMLLGSLDTSGTDFASFQVGSGKNIKKKDIELRLELHLGDTTALKDRTIIYWSIVPHNDAAATKEIKDRLKALGYSKEEKDDHPLTAIGAFVVSDGSDNLFGGHPNPPFPPGGSGFFKRRHRVAPGGLLLGLLGGLVLASLLPGALGLRRTGR